MKRGFLLSAVAVWLVLGSIPLAGQEEPKPPPEEESGESSDGPESGDEGATEQSGTDRIEFRLPLPEDQGGGTVTGIAGSLEYREEEVVILSDGVEIHHENVVLRAERMQLDLSTQVVTAEGNVILDQGPSRMTGATVSYDLEEKTGILTQATAAVQGGYYFSGDELARLSETEFTIEEGTFTACKGEVPPWSFHVGRARVEVEGYARIHDASMRVKTLPVIYTPYLLWPTKTERTSGLLIPKVGYSDDRGAYLGLAHFQTLGRSYDTTIFADLYSEGFTGLGNELRYHPTEGTEGRFEGYAIRDPDEDDTRWKVRWDHTTRDLPRGLRAVAHFEDYSDFRFFRDFERQLNAKAQSSVYSNAFLTGNWGSHSLNLMVDRRENFLFQDRVVELSQLPELEYSIRPTRIGSTPLYYSLDSAAHFLSVDRSEAYRGEYSRFHLRPTLRLPLSRWPWLSVSVDGGGVFTWWENSLDRDAGPIRLSDESLTRALPIAGAEIVGPSFSRIFEGNLGAFGKFKHLIEPRVTWAFSDEFEDRELVPRFDELDTVSSRNTARIVLTNRVLGKPAPEEPEEDQEVGDEGEDGGEEDPDVEEKDAEEGDQEEMTALERVASGSAREIFSFELSRRYSFDESEPLERGGEMESQWGPWEATLRSYPSDRFGFRLDLDYSDLFSQLTSVRLTGNVGFGPG
ncbi:MAG: LPS assembly protein LptD, partial [Thermoanaerobaculia bacterium]|nr:LPS assembly protein LptD [Thermoanaerobaculia bacterium]